MVKLKTQQPTSRLRIITEANGILEVKINTGLNNKYYPITNQQSYRPLAYLFYPEFQTPVYVLKNLFVSTQSIVHAYLQMIPYLYKVNDIGIASLYKRMYNQSFHIIHLYSNHVLHFPADSHQYESFL